MAKFIEILVGTTYRRFSAENIITTERTAATTTTITYNHAQATFDVLTLTHTTDASTTKVVDALNTTIEQVHSPDARPDVVRRVNLPVAVSGVAFA